MEDSLTAGQLLERMVRLGGDSYFGEPVTVLEHCLQAAHFAREAEAATTQVVAALLHDVGHLLHGEGEAAADHGRDTRHEELADELLRAHLPLAVTEPIRMHVAAKRFLCAVDGEYLETLSASSRQSLALQGGVMTAREAEDFLKLPFAAEAVALRRWDDEAKIPALVVPGVESYRVEVEALWT
jgi:phosphonate degradation associated HDIG domain protein